MIGFERLPVLYARTLRMFARLRLSRCYQTLEGREDRVEYLLGDMVN